MNGGNSGSTGRRAPEPVTNPPGLSAIGYRAGTHDSFLNAMLAAMIDPANPGLSGLRTRDPADFTVGLLDALATVADVLTIYQERIANESYLLTATEPVSLHDLGRLVGYTPGAGVAAGGWLAFTLDPSVTGSGPFTIDAGTKVQSVPGPGALPQTFETLAPAVARASWNALRASLTTPTPLDPGLSAFYAAGTDTRLQPGDTVLVVAGGGPTLRRVQSVRPDALTRRTQVLLDPKSDPPRGFDSTLTSDGVYAFRVSAALFGQNASEWGLLSADYKAAYLTARGLSTSLATQSDWPDANTVPLTLQLDRAYPSIVAGSVVAFVPPRSDLPVSLRRAASVAEVAASQYALSARVTSVTLDTFVRFLPLDGTSRPQSDTMRSLRGTIVLAQGEPIALAGEPITAVEGAVLALADPTDGLAAGQVIAVSGRPVGSSAAVSEVATVAAVAGPTLALAAPLRNRYAPETVTVNANLAWATHGETVRETLGSGDASQTFQRFVLRQSPLTRVGSPTATGSLSTLQVRVDGVLWHEVDTLLGHGPTERVYVTTTDEQGTTTVGFGDGKTGSRLSTGRDNVRGIYRRGLGRAGQVDAGSLTLLPGFPLGVKGVTNPEPTAGAQDPEGPDEARRSIPLAARTLGRVVSLSDYEDVTRAFAGIAKASATTIYVEGRRGLLMTVAGIDGDGVDESGALATNLLASLHALGDPRVPLALRSYRRAWFAIDARVCIDPDLDADAVRRAATDTMRAAFGFDARKFGQGVSPSEVVAALQGVPGVLAAVVERLQRGDDAGPPASPPAPLSTRPALVLPDGTLVAAELLALAPLPYQPSIRELA